MGARPGPRVFVLLGGLLVACKLIDKMGGLGLPLFVRVLPLILVVAGFSWMRVNPFKIDPELELEGK